MSGSVALVRIQSHQRSYMASEKLVFTVTNSLNKPIATLNQRTYCSTIVLEKQTETDWQPVSNCTSNSPSLEVTIKADSRTTVELAPGPHALGNMPTGNYRAKLVFTVGDHFMPADTQQVFSEIFAVQ
ncbi:hypothetical protein Q0590_24370 [Rhodocytophaga aerolata]|uniref:DUF1573 domain-containing protein n=1 Tax=Rhodocytophaga aerolata TaxID=455078 RepID=A0ABT8RBE2_9BACT|nr:hypothetical protein [Rhodocytophaga aerolata]MDO1449433.1 hypothetical protein [Rhodocytophaga aerolata]